MSFTAPVRQQRIADADSLNPYVGLIFRLPFPTFVFADVGCRRGVASDSSSAVSSLTSVSSVRIVVSIERGIPVSTSTHVPFCAVSTGVPCVKSPVRWIPHAAVVPSDAQPCGHCAAPLPPSYTVLHCSWSFELSTTRQPYTVQPNTPTWPSGAFTAQRHAFSPSGTLLTTEVKVLWESGSDDASLGSLGCSTNPPPVAM